MKEPVVLICTPCKNPQGGVESIIGDLCRNLPFHGFQVVLGLGKGFRFNDSDRYRKTWPGLKYVDIDGTSGTRAGRLKGLRTAISDVDPDIVLIARLFDAYEVVAQLKQRHGRPRLAVTIQVYQPSYIFDASLYRNNIDLCVTSGELIRQALIHWSRLPQERVVSIPGGVEPPKKSLQPRSPGQILRIGYVGRIEAVQKRIFDLIPFLIEMDKQGISYTFDLIGSGLAEAELLPKLAPWLREGKLKFHGWQDHEALYTKFFPELDCFVHFAATEGVTIAPREGMIHGVVPIVSEFLGLRAEGHFKNGENALTFPVGDHPAAVRAVMRLLKEPDLMRTLSENAMHSQTGRYSYQGAIVSWAEAFRRCLDSPGAMSPLPSIKRPADGRLARLGVPSGFAERVRNFLKLRYVHTDPGSEWPVFSGLMTAEAESSIKDFPSSHEAMLDADLTKISPHF